MNSLLSLPNKIDEQCFQGGTRSQKLTQRVMEEYTCCWLLDSAGRYTHIFLKTYVFFHYWALNVNSISTIRIEKTNKHVRPASADETHSSTMLAFLGPLTVHHMLAPKETCCLPQPRIYICRVYSFLILRVAPTILWRTYSLNAPLNLQCCCFKWLC